jgi:hypothetical protein
MEDYFDITFDLDGVVFEGKVWPELDSDGNSFYQITYHPSDHPEQHKMIFIEMAAIKNDPLTIEWKQKKDWYTNEIVSEDMVCAIAAKVKTHEE